jgi:hypothetical protein
MVHGCVPAPPAQPYEIPRWFANQDGSKTAKMGGVSRASIFPLFHLPPKGMKWEWCDPKKVQLSDGPLAGPAVTSTKVD